MAWMKKGIFIALVVVIGGYVLLCLGLYEWGLHGRPDAFRTPPPVLPTALVEQVAAMEGLGHQPMARLDPITLLPRLWLEAGSQEPRSHWQATVATVSRVRPPPPEASDRGARRHLTKTADAIYVSRHWTREQVLSALANAAYYGRDAHGLEAAAQAWYGLPLAQLRPEEITAMWALQWAPSSMDPFCQRDRFEKRYATLAKRLENVNPADVPSAIARMSASSCR